jgi:predicted nuclease of restriction endonuclease-like (RecB) superfamily
MSDTSSLASEDNSYIALLEGLKQRIKSAQIRAALAVNQELIWLYWQIGQDILQRQQVEGWGGKVIERLSKDLRREFPDMKGFSARNLGYMKAFAIAWPDEQILHQLGAKIPWRHNTILIEMVKDPQARYWYIQKTIENGWSRNVLILQIESGLYERRSDAIANFQETLPLPQSDLARQIVKDPYNFEFLSIAEDAKEQEIERALVTHIRDFQLELGMGFSFVGSRYPLTIGGEDFYLDLLFYHLELRCFIVIDLKMGEFKAEYSGKMNLYVSAVDELLRKEHDHPTIGIVLCKSKNKTVAEYALRNLNTPIAVSTYRLQDRLPPELKENLPTAEQLETELEAAVAELKQQHPDAGDS